LSSIKLIEKMKNKDKNRLKYILNIVKPDLVHIHGSEFRHTFEFAQICKLNNIKSVISIQGLVSTYSNHMKSNLPNKIYYGKTVRDFIRGDSVFNREKQFAQRGQFEKRAIKLSGNVIGRTTWDKAAIKEFSEEIKYYHNNENLRSAFYKSKWDLKKIQRQRIFISQASYSIKGFHYMIEEIGRAHV